MNDKKHFKHCILAVCRDESALRSVLSKKGLAHNDLVIASDDIRVHKKYVDLKIVYFNQMETLFTVAPYVIETLESINRWLRDLGDDCKLQAGIIDWVQHVEGGDTTQRILDAVLEARTCFTLLARFKPVKVIIGTASKPYWEDEVLIACALHRGIPIYKLNDFNPNRVLRGLWQRLRPLSKEVYRSLMTFDSILRRKSSGFKGPGFGEYVAIQLCSSALKHLNHTLPLLKSFERENITSVAVTWEIGKTAKSLRLQGHKVVELEAWVAPKIILYSWWTTYKIIRKAKEKINSFLTADKESEYAPIIRTVLLKSVRSFFFAELPQRIRFAAACKIYFTRNPPRAARLWTRILAQGVIAYRTMETIGVRPLLFWQAGWPYQLEWPYLRHDVPADIIFCLNNVHRERLITDGQSDSNIIVSAIQWLPHVVDFAMHTSPQQSRSLLGINPQAKLVVFCDAQYILGGFCTVSEQILLVKTVIEFVERYKDVYALIKPHPAHKPGQLEAMFGGRCNGQIIWIPGKNSPYNGINAANVVLAKFSTLVSEAMVMNVPSICVLLDNEMRWAIYEDAVDYAFSTEELNEKLEALHDAQFYESWAESIRKKQKDYIMRHFPKPEEDCYDLIAREVKDALRRR